MIFFFFFSSRRRHTRLQGDWSSDVCSSDLGKAVATAAALDGDGWRLHGTKTLVVDGLNADLLVVVARAGGELGFFIVEGEAPGLNRTRLAGLDLTRQLASLELSGTPARRLVCEDAAGALS